MSDAKAIERANAYREMTNSWAFKDLMSRFVEEKNSRLEKLMAQKGSEDLERTKGFVEAVHWLDTEVGFVIGEAK